MELTSGGAHLKNSDCSTSSTGNQDNPVNLVILINPLQKRKTLIQIPSLNTHKVQITFNSNFYLIWEFTGYEKSF